MLTILRSVVYQTVLVLSTLIFGSAVIVTAKLLPFSDPNRLAQSWARVNLFALKVICRLDYRITGSENIPSGAAIVMSKHQSAWETISLRAILPVDQTWVLKSELLRVPILGRALVRLSPIAIDRSAGMRSMRQLLTQGESALRLSRLVVLFPEGTRVAHGEIGRYNMGGAVLAERTGYPVVPIAHNAGLYWKRRSFIRYPGTVSVVVGPSIPSQGKSAKEIMVVVEEWIERTLVLLPDVRDVGRGSGAAT
jgi:1-acyl-sn-glycerol-3-phosphate acyltransferase